MDEKYIMKEKHCKLCGKTFEYPVREAAQHKSSRRYCDACREIRKAECAEITKAKRRVKTHRANRVYKDPPEKGFRISPRLKRDVDEAYEKWIQKQESYVQKNLETIVLFTPKVNDTGEKSRAYGESAAERYMNMCRKQERSIG